MKLKALPTTLCVIRGTEQTQTRGGTEVEIEVVEPLSGGGSHLDVAAVDREWRVNVSANGTPELVTGWNSHGEVDADAELPDWIEDALAHVGRE